MEGFHFEILLCQQPRIEASFDKINLTMRHKSGVPADIEPPPKMRSAGHSPALPAFALTHHHSAEQTRSRPGPPPTGAGRFISALTGAGRWSILLRGQTRVSAAVSGGAVSGVLLPSMGWAAVPGAFGGWRGRQPLSSRTPSTPAAGF